MELLLQKQELLDLGENMRDVNIVCREGRCWLTQTDDSRDHILGVGDHFKVNRRKHLIITATEPCRLMFIDGLPGQPQRPVQALCGFLKGFATGDI